MTRMPAPSPLEIAIVYLSRLAAVGTSPGRMSREVKSVIDGWHANEPTKVEEWATTLRDEITAGLADAVEQAESVDASDGAGAAKQAQAVVEALRAALNAIEGELVGA